MKVITKATLLLTALLGLSVSLAQAEDAKTIWDKQCAKCHGKDGNGSTTAMGKKLGIKDYTDAKVQAQMKDEDMAKAIKDGVQKDGKTTMKPTEGVTDDDVKALIKLIRDFKK
ncbi:MAG TPA: cytochrome c [Verrucomicrobiota bacterium]|nr:cytochrome c [Verrucomicrobiota bacterium]